MSKSMFPLLPNQEEEPNATHEFTALSLSTGIQGRNQLSSLPYIGNRRKNSSELLETLTKVKRQRSLDGTALSIGPGTGSGSSGQLSMNEITDNAVSVQQMYANLCARSGIYGGECYRAKPVNEGNVRADEAGIYNQFLKGFSSDYRRGRRTGGVDSDPEVISNDTNRAIPFQQQPVNGLRRTGAAGSGKKSYGRGGGASFRIEKLRHRMIKNRESAARSRARKQALEAQQQLENTELKKENDVLKRIVRILMAILRTKHLKLPTLTRSFSATF